MAKILYDPVGRCIYCGESRLPAGTHKFGDEHIVPLAFGGNLILPEASCGLCEKIINRQIETPILSEEWGFLRSKLTFPTRNKKRRKTHVNLRRKDGRRFKMPINDYSSPVPLYKFGEARILSGLPAGFDDKRWTMAMLSDEKAELAAQNKYPEWDKRHQIRARPHTHARLLAKIAYAYLVAEMGLGSFEPFVLDIILGHSQDYFYTVGGSWDPLPPREGGGHTFNINMAIRDRKALVIVDIRLFSELSLPGYHVVVGYVDFRNAEHAQAFEEHYHEGRLVVVPSGSNTDVSTARVQA